MSSSLRFTSTTDQRNRYTVRISSGAERGHRAKDVQFGGIEMQLKQEGNSPHKSLGEITD